MSEGCQGEQVGRAGKWWWIEGDGVQITYD